MPTVLSLDDLGIHQPPTFLVEPVLHAVGSSGKADAQEDLGRFAGETVTNLRHLVVQAEEEVRTRGVEFLEELISRLARIEESTRAEWTSMLESRTAARQAHRNLQKLPESAPGRKELLERIEGPLTRMEQWIEAAEAVLPAYRDARWQLMALRADHEDAGEAPVLDDPEQLEKYLARG